jgi:hypothetical protein
VKKEEGKHRRQGKELEHIHTGQGDVVMEYEVGTEAEEAMEHNVDVVA